VVKEGVWWIVMGEVNDTARRLLREMGNQARERSPSNLTPEVVPREAAEKLDLDSQAPAYTAALKHLLALGDIERISEPAATEAHYRLTKQGLRRAHEIRWWR
jgi:hypothetical protein